MNFLLTRQYMRLFYILRFLCLFPLLTQLIACTPSYPYIYASGNSINDSIESIIYNKNIVYILFSREYDHYVQGLHTSKFTTQKVELYIAKINIQELLQAPKKTLLYQKRVEFYKIGELSDHLNGLYLGINPFNVLANGISRRGCSVYSGECEVRIVDKVDYSLGKIFFNDQEHKIIVEVNVHPREHLLVTIQNKDKTNEKTILHPYKLLKDSETYPLILNREKSN